ncbi:hypothetical protein [Ornithobacterium rhinotracheale]|uniref:hypothetical protein n=1 Tax=Ornithobacterium rhinotracheale TaxID=28251 RepID=UPI00403963E8
MSDCVLVIDNRRFRTEYVCQEVASIDLFVNCYYQVGPYFYTANAFKRYLIDKSDYVIYKRLIPLDGEPVKDLPTFIDGYDSNSAILSSYPVGTFYDGFVVTKTKDGYYFRNSTSKFVGVYLDVSDPYSNEVCQLESGQEFDYKGSGPFVLYNGDEEIRGIE